jgi:hypothetical protein
VPWNGRVSDKRFTGAASGISKPRISNDFFHNANAGKFINPEEFSPIPQLTTNVLLPQVKQNNQSELCNAYKSFSLEQAVSGVSREESRTSGKETSRKKSYLDQGIKIFKEA